MQLKHNILKWFNIAKEKHGQMFGKGHLETTEAEVFGKL